LNSRQQLLREVLPQLQQQLKRLPVGQQTVVAQVQLGLQHKLQEKQLELVLVQQRVLAASLNDHPRHT
jgi:hypothetical protein